MLNEYQLRVLIDAQDRLMRILEAHRARFEAIQRVIERAARWLEANRAAIDAFLNPRPMELVAAFPMPVRQTHVLHVEPSASTKVRRRRRRRIGFIIEYD